MNERPLRVLVTGIGGFYAQAVVKALRLSRRPIACEGCDADANGLGQAFVEAFHLVPPADDPSYASCMDALCSRRRIDAVIAGTEPERQVLAHLGSPPRLPCGVPVIEQEPSWMDTYGDKLACYRALDDKVQLAPFADGGDPPAVDRLVATTGFPLVVKSRRSSGSKTLHVVPSAAALRAALIETPLPVVQGFIDSGDGEYSAGVFRHDGLARAIAFRRELGHAGCSWIAETSEDPMVLDYVLRVAHASGLRGAANIQVRKSGCGVRLLEINPRFSSLVAARAYCGFRDVEWWLALALGEQPSLPDGPFRHIRYRRCFSEMTDVGSGFYLPREWVPRVQEEGRPS